MYSRSGLHTKSASDEWPATKENTRARPPTPPSHFKNLISARAFLDAQVEGIRLRGHRLHPFYEGLLADIRAVRELVQVTNVGDLTGEADGGAVLAFEIHQGLLVSSPPVHELLRLATRLLEVAVACFSRVSTLVARQPFESTIASFLESSKFHLQALEDLPHRAVLLWCELLACCRGLLLLLAILCANH